MKKSKKASGPVIVRLGRRKPYTEIGIRRVPCQRCGRPSRTQWQICSLGNGYLGVCRACDIGLNDLVLHWMNIPNAQLFSRVYARRFPLDVHKKP